MSVSQEDTQIQREEGTAVTASGHLIPSSVEFEEIKKERKRRHKEILPKDPEMELKKPEVRDGIKYSNDRKKLIPVLPYSRKSFQFEGLLQIFYILFDKYVVNCNPKIHFLLNIIVKVGWNLTNNLHLWV